MNIQVERKNGLTVATITGKIDATTSGDLEDVLLEAIDQGSTDILLDMAGVNYISSAGLRILLLAAKQVYGSGQLGLCSLQENVIEIIEMSGFSSFMTIYPGLPSAKQQMSV